MVLVTGLVLVPSTVASASHHRAHKLRLALVPLQKAQLGVLGNGLALDYGSGPTWQVAHPNDGLKAFDIRLLMDRAGLAPFGIPRYTLDYGDPFTGSTGVMEIRTSVEEYNTRVAAKAGYHRWRQADSSLHRYLPGGQWAKIKVTPVGPRNFAYLGSWAAPSLNPIVGLDEQVLAGRFVLDLTVFAGSVDAAEQAAPSLARRLYHRLRWGLAGHLKGNPVTLPPKPKAGQAADGPDLSTMILQPSDVGQAIAPSVQQQYAAFPPTGSTYFMDMTPAGQYDQGIHQDIFWWPTATEATYAGAYVRAGSWTGSPVDLGAVGDNATGTIGVSVNGAGVIVTLTHGRAGEIIWGWEGKAGSAPTAADVQSLAQAAANRLDAGLGP